VFTSFSPAYHYYEILFLGYGARPLENWNEICACAERFKCTKAERADGTSITFFRQSPLVKDIPLTPPDTHMWPLSRFASGEYGGSMTDIELYQQSNRIVREMVKDRWGPIPGRTFNPYDGCLNTPVRIVEQ
jgi:hypothetical protein